MQKRTESLILQPQNTVGSEEREREREAKGPVVQTVVLIISREQWWGMLNSQHRSGPYLGPLVETIHGGRTCEE